MFSLPGLILRNKVEVVIKLNLCNSCISLTEGHQMLCVSRDAQHCLDNPVILFAFKRGTDYESKTLLLF